MIAVAASRRCHLEDYPEVNPSGAGRLLALGVEVFGRWGEDSLTAVLALAAARCESLPPRLRLGLRLRLLRRWWGLLGIAVQRAVARAISRGGDADMAASPMEAFPGLADLPL